MDREVLHVGDFRRFVRVSGWEFIERLRSPQIVVMIPVKEDKTVIFVEQFRVPIQRKMIEFPAGLVHDLDSNQHESLEESARRELIEETGYLAKKLTFILEGPANSALATDMLSIFLAQDLVKVGKGGGDETENIEVHEVSLASVDAWLDDRRSQGNYIDPKVYAGLYYIQKYL